MTYIPNILSSFLSKFKTTAKSNNSPEASAGVGHSHGAFSYGNGSQDNGSKWNGGLATYMRSVFINHFVVRSNARYAYHTSLQAKAIVNRHADVVAGVGLMLEATPKNEILGITPEAAEKWSSDVESKFDCWARSKLQHRAELMNWYQTHRSYCIFQPRDGEVFVRLFYTNDKKVLSKLQYEFIDPNQIRGDAYTNSMGIHISDDGIIRDSRNRETAYKIWSQDKDGTAINRTINKKGQKSGRVFMLHGFSSEFPLQRRGFSRLSHALQEFQDITGFTQAQVKKAINHSNITMVVEPSKDHDSSNPFEGITNTKAGPKTVNKKTETSTTIDSGPIVEFCRLDEATLEVPGSTGVYNLRRGEKLTPFSSSAPSEGFDSFVNSFTSHISASLSQPLEVTLMKFNANYSASRAALILFWQVAQIWREEMSTDYCNPVYEMWLSEEIAAGRVSAPGWSDPRLRAAWVASRWIGTPMPNIDPSKTSKAIKDHLEMGLSDIDKEARNLNGSVGKTNRSRLKKQLKELADVPWGAGAKNQKGVQNG